MKYKINAILCLILLFAACQNSGTKKSSNPSNKEKKPNEETSDTRPKEQIVFLQKVKDNSGYNTPTDAIERDGSIASFNKYATDSLKNVKNWEFTVVEINDNSYGASSIIKVLGNADEEPIYNLMLVSEFEIDNTADTVSIDNRVDFTYTTPKNPKNENLKKILKSIKALKSGDVVLVSGDITHLNERGKVDFSSFYSDFQPWDLDIIVSDIRKKPAKK